MIVSVSAAAPAVAEAGESVVITGTGLFTAKDNYPFDVGEYLQYDGIAMTSSEQAIEIAEEIVRMQAEAEALRIILKRSWNDPDTPWEKYVSLGTDQILALETTRQRCAQLRSAFDSAKDDGSLIRALHDEILGRAKVS